jgi:D-tyrosyl-tRNA(Tyr) deacylase
LSITSLGQHDSACATQLRMRAVVQRVNEASVTVGGEVVGAIERGLLVYLGAARADEAKDVQYTADKIAGLRVFPNDEGRMSLCVTDIGGAVLVVSQFTLFGDVRRGRRPSFDGAAEPNDAERLYLEVVEALRRKGLPVETGTFRAMMLVQSVVEGPVTIQIDSRKLY